jgi:hypothetical protein
MTWMFYGCEILHVCGYGIKYLLCIKLSVWLDYVKSHSTKRKYESWKVTPGKVSTSTIFLPKYSEEKIKSEYICGFLPNFASAFGLLKHVRHRWIFTSLYEHDTISAQTYLTLVGSVLDWQKGSEKWCCFDDWGWLQFLLTMRLIALESLSLYITMHMKNIQIRGSTHPMCQFENKVVLDPEINSKSDFAILNWIGSLP